jgi:hypothetical protein
MKLLWSLIIILSGNYAFGQFYSIDKTILNNIASKKVLVELKSESVPVITGKAKNQPPDNSEFNKKYNDAAQDHFRSTGC